MKIWPTLKRKLYILFPESAPLLKWVVGGQIVLFPLWVNYCIKYQRLAFTMELECRNFFPILGLSLIIFRVNCWVKNPFFVIQ